jgi:DNA-binding transcriptional LysR family regulator
MRIEYYREFLELARCLNFTEAAANLHITQPALSKHISALEKEYGATLFVRNKRNVQLSEAGRIIFGAATNFVATCDHAKQSIRELMRKTPIRVDGVLYDDTVASIMSLSTVLLSGSDHAPIIFSHKDDVSFIELLEKGEVDLVFSYATGKTLTEKGLAFRPLARNQFVAILDKDHRLANCAEITIDDLKDETLIQFVDEYSLPGWQRIEEVCQAHGFEPKRRPVFGRTAMSYATTPPNGDVLILQKNLRWIKFMVETNQLPCIPVVGEDAAFLIDCIYKKASEEKLNDFLYAIEESRDIIFRHQDTKLPFKESAFFTKE